jgi:hypothetical protein
MSNGQAPTPRRRAKGLLAMIDETEPGSGSDENDGVAEQLSVEDSLLDTRIEDVLDEGYSPPDREPSVHVPTEAEEERGESLDELLSAETPEVWADDDDDNLFDESGDEVGGSRAGRLVGVGSDGFSDIEKDLLGDDVGIDGAGASAEEAAVHVIDEYDQR